MKIKVTFVGIGVISVILRLYFPFQMTTICHMG